jgi:GxxExxY protein
VDYENALAATLTADAIPFQRQPRYLILYRCQQIGEYRPDMTLAGGALQLDLKATATIAPLHKEQMLSYLA